jgi:hypothetical protein
MPGISHQLHWSVRVICNNLYLLALLDTPEQAFGGLGVTERRLEESIVLAKLVARRVSIRELELVEDVLYTHGRVPANEAGVR